MCSVCATCDELHDLLFIAGVDGQSVYISNIVDVRKESNKVCVVYMCLQ